MRRTSSLFFRTRGLVGLGCGGGDIYSFGMFVHSCILKLEMV